VIQAYYGTAPRYSYWVGCSTGGRQGLQEAQRYPEDFDGLVIGAPVLYSTGNSMRRIWAGQTQAGAGAIPVEKLPLLAKLVYHQCDAVDGLKDGIIDDPRRCGLTHRATCPGARASKLPTASPPRRSKPSARFMVAVRDSKGKLLFPGEPVGGEAMWAQNLIGPSGLVLPRAESYMKSPCSIRRRPVLELHHVQLRYRTRRGWPAPARS